MADFSNIPCDILIDIFSRIPIKSLVQLRCVSKSLLHFITDSLVFNMHVSYSKNLKILINDFKCWYALDCISFDKAIEVDNGMFKSENNELDVIGWGSCMGFILLSFKKRQHHGVFYVWNPCTGEYIKLPDLGFPAHSYTLGVYYNSSVGNYEFVVVAYGESNILPKCNSYADICSLATSGSWGKIKSYADIYSLATGSWRKIESIPYKIPKWAHAILVDGFLHWIAAHESSESVKSDLVIAFDIGGDKFQEVPLPNGMNPNCFLDITELGGELCLVCNYKIRVEAWLMKDYGVKSSWTKLFNIKQSPGVYFRSLIPLCFTKDGILILHMDGTMLVQYHPIVGCLFLLKIKGMPEEWFEPIIYYEGQVVINQGETKERVLRSSMNDLI